MGFTGCGSHWPPPSIINVQKAQWWYLLDLSKYSNIQIWNVIYFLVCSEVINEMIIPVIIPSPGSYHCEMCGVNFDDEKRLKNHKGLIHGLMLFKCHLCSKAFQYSSQVDWHMRSHKNRGANSAKSGGSSKMWKSKNKTSYSNSIVSQAAKFSKARSAYVCQFCGAKFSQVHTFVFRIMQNENMTDGDRNELHWKCVVANFVKTMRHET